MQGAFTFALLGTLSLATACAHNAPEPAEPKPSEPMLDATGSAGPLTEDQPGTSPTADATAAPSRANLSAEQCGARGGNVVGDIGDGAIFRDDYACPSGAEPLGNITASPNGPMGVEGSVCCPP